MSVPFRILSAESIWYRNQLTALKKEKNIMKRADHDNHSNQLNSINHAYWQRARYDWEEHSEDE
jgi:hypothetical protein